jgi:hypothetical protein
VTVEVVVPWRAGCPHREAAWRWVRARWDATGWPVTVAELPDGPWVKARAVMPAVEASSAEIVIVADADCWSPAVPEAVEAVRAGASWAMPHGRVFRFTPEVTARVLAGDEPERFGPNDTAEQPYWGVAGGGIVAIRRDVALDVPLDPRFEGWGGDDHSWGFALGTLWGYPWRSEAPVWHLWHPAQRRMTRMYGSERSEALRRRYFAAQHKPGEMRAIVDEAKAVGVA